MPSAPPVLSGFSYVRPLGTGGFADVFLFEQNMPRRSVAVKVLLREVVDDDVIRMFNSEADVMARLSAHPSIVTVHAASISADGRPYLVMEYCPGSAAARYRQERMPPAAALHLGVKIASALETAHRAGLLHRDIKPSNILTTEFGAPVLADFGIATSLAGGRSEQLIAMSLPWSAPEVVDERTSGTVASEVWGFGATLYSLIAGRTPFEAPGVKLSRDQLRARILRARYQPIDGAAVPESLDALLRRMLQRDAAARPGSMLEVAHALQLVQYELGIAPTPLEIASEQWAATAAPIDFDDTVMRGATISEVEVDSARRPRSQRASARRDRGDVDESGTGGEPGRSGRRRRATVAGYAAAGLLLAGAVGTGIALVTGGG
ncbi:serine/threonine-protein kinase [Ruicaihuangia caeni]|uniref:serine/threonine-protein kinase n=1 Tax=Ruicaihuangia caeni TaxID=3042517 RepID=UPI00338F7721